MATIKKCFSCFTLLSMIVVPTLAQLCTDFYDDVCPMALPTIKSIVAEAIAREPRMGASLIRLHFHDCFVNGCDGSILLDDTPIFTGEKTARPNANSVRGFDVIDEIKAAIYLECLGNVVSCADILAVAARDSVVELRGASYDVLVGRRDSLTASKDDAEKNMPTPFDDFDTLLAKFRSQGLTLEDLVILSGAHTVGFARCTVFRSRIYNETATIDSDFARSVQMKCPLSGNDNNLTSLDESAASFDNVYFQDLAQMKGLLHSDQQLFQGTGSESDGLVQYYIKNPEAFWANFGEAMIKMGSISPLTGTEGEIRGNCRVVNQNF